MYYPGHAPGQGNALNRLTAAAVLPEGWHKISPGLWRHDNGEESRINPSSLFTNSKFASLKSEESSENVLASVTDGNMPPRAQSTSVHQSQPPQQAPLTGATSWWYIGQEDQQHGPVSSEQLSRLFDSGHVKVLTYVWSQHLGSEWQPLKHSGFEYIAPPDARPQQAAVATEISLDPNQA
jgi:hypothetical protein